MGFTSAAVHPNNVVATMSGGEKQGVAITRALYFEAELVILDEPTMGLSLSETRKTLDFVGNIKKAGKSAIFIDHNIFNVYPVVDRLYVLDRGKVAGVYLRSEITIDELIDRLYRVARTGSMGRRHGRTKPCPHAPPTIAARRRRCCALRQPDGHHRRRLRDVARLRHRRAARVHRHRHLSRLRGNDAAIRHRRGFPDLRRHHRRDRPVVSLPSWRWEPGSSASSPTTAARRGGSA